MSRPLSSRTVRRPFSMVRRHSRPGKSECGTCPLAGPLLPCARRYGQRGSASLQPYGTGQLKQRRWSSDSSMFVFISTAISYPGLTGDNPNGLL